MKVVVVGGLSSTTNAVTITTPTTAHDTMIAFRSHRLSAPTAFATPQSSVFVPAIIRQSLTTVTTFRPPTSGSSDR